MRWRSRVLVLAAVFCLFGAVGLMGMQMSTSRFSAGEILVRVLLAGGFAIAYFSILISRRFKLFAPVGIAQAVVMWLVVRRSGTSWTLSGIALQQLILLASCAIVGIIVAYSLMIHLFAAEGQRYFKMRTEMALAAEIHSSLVPECAATLGGFEIYGASVPSGEVGGDLVDLVEQQGGWIAYVADVSGHGVQSGVLMAMFKTALRTQMATDTPLGQMLHEVHRTLFPLKLSSMFVTVGILRGGERGRVEFASAGHPAILHYHKASGTVSEHAALDPPLGIVEAQEFSDATIQCAPGDILLVLTDGLTEVFSATGNELGIEKLKATLLACADSSLDELSRQLRKTAAEFGPQTDDQTILAARYKN